MMSGGFGASRGDVLRLFEGESVAGLGDGELLERFADRRDEAAFEALVARFGPMVLGTCRRMLSGRHDVDDAFQATFLVLVRRAGSIRDRDLVGPWLHGVATRVARRARVQSARRAARERVAVVAEAQEDEAGLESEWPELRALIDEEIERLPEHHRRPIVLCDVEGLSREEAAIRLGWTLNMVRGRLERARDRLRGRLARRGLAPSDAWAALVASPTVPPSALLVATTRAALSFSVARMGTGLASASAVALSRGVLRMMMLSKLKLGLALLLSTGFVAAGSGMLAAQGLGDKPAAKAAVAPAVPPQVDFENRVVVPAAVSDPFKPRSAADLAKARIEMALRRFKIQKDFYEQGRITVDRLVGSSSALMEAERDAAVTKAARVEAIRTHYSHLVEFLRREEAELAAGRATEADVTEMKTAILDTEFALAKELEAPEAKPSGADAKATSTGRPIQSRLGEGRVAAAKLRFDTQRAFHDEGRITLDRFVAASRALMDAELDASRTKEARIAAVKAHIARLKQEERREEDEWKKQAEEGDKFNEAAIGRVTVSDLTEIKSQVLDAEDFLAKESGTADRPAEGVAPVPGGPLPTTRPADPTSPLGSDKDRVEAARKAYEAAVHETLVMCDKELYSQILGSSRAELFYLWSRRWMEAQRNLAGENKGDEIAAVEAHLGRMKDLETGGLLKAWVKRKGEALPTDEGLAAALQEIPTFQTSLKYYRMEAESWLSKAKSR